MIPSVSDLISTISFAAMLPTSESDSVTAWRLASTATTWTGGRPPAGPPCGFLHPVKSCSAARPATMHRPVVFGAFNISVPVFLRGRAGEEQIYNSLGGLAVQPAVRHRQVGHQV